MKQLICDVCQQEISRSWAGVGINMQGEDVFSWRTEYISLDVCLPCLKNTPEGIWAKVESRLGSQRKEIEEACSEFV